MTDTVIDEIVLDDDGDNSLDIGDERVAAAMRAAGMIDEDGFGGY